MKKALKPYSQLQPHTRRQRLMDFSDRILSSAAYGRTREEFGLEMDRELVQVDAHVIDGEKLFFNGPEDVREL